MKQQIKKLCKQLSRFTFDEIASILEMPDNKVEEIIQELITEETIKKISETEYAYIPKVILYAMNKDNSDNKIDPTSDEKWISLEQAVALTGFAPETIRRKCKKGEYITKSCKNGKYKNYSILKSSIYKVSTTKLNNILVKDNMSQINFKFDIDSLFSDSQQQKLFDDAQEYNKHHIIKYLNIFKLTNGLRGNELKKMLNQIAAQNPNYRISYSSYVRWKSQYARYGLSGLMKTYNLSNKKSCVSDDLLDEFEKIYLTPKQYSVRIAWEILKSKHPDEIIPSDKSFHRAINKRYSSEYIKKKRTVEVYIPEYKDLIPIKTNKKIYEKVKDAFDDYLMKLENKEDDRSICSRGYIKNHLYPFFGTYKFKDITQDTLVIYQSKMLADGYSVASIKRFVALLQKIMKKYSDNDNLKFSTQETILPSLEFRVLNQHQIYDIIMNNDKIQELWILGTGITPAELKALDYSDIDYTNKTVNITKTTFRNRVESIRAKYKIRTLKLPKLLFNKIPKKGNGHIFKDVNIDNYDKLLNTHIKLMLEKNVQLNIISKNIGFQKVTEFENRFNFLLPQHLNKTFDIFD